jgi:hypothetical protein
MLVPPVGRAIWDVRLCRGRWRDADNPLVDVPHEIDPLLAEVDSLTPGRIAALAARFSEAESSTALSARRALARDLALSPDTPGAISVLAGQLTLSEAMLSLEAVYEIDEDTAYAARAAVLDMGLVMCLHTMAASGAEALAEPWLAATAGPTGF